MFLLDNLGFVHFYWGSVWRLWPLVIVVIGINLLLPKNLIGNVLSVLVITGSFCVLVFVGSTFSPRVSSYLDDPNHNKIETDGYEQIRSKGNIRETFTQDLQDSIDIVNLKIKGGAITYKINRPTDQHLFYAETESDFSSNRMRYFASRGAANISFVMDTEKKKDVSLDGARNNAVISLNSIPVWNLDLDLGAGSAEFDLSGNKIQKMDVDCGAASFDAILGPPLAKSEISVNSGVGSVKLQIPKGTPCYIRVRAGLSSEDFPGFEKVTDKAYQTPGFSASLPHYVIDLRGGLSSFTVELIR